MDMHTYDLSVKRVRSSLSLSHSSLEGYSAQSIVDAVLLISSAGIRSDSSIESSRITVSGVDLLDVVTSELVDGDSIVDTADELSLFGDMRVEDISKYVV